MLKSPKLRKCKLYPPVVAETNKARPAAAAAAAAATAGVWRAAASPNASILSHCAIERDYLFKTAQSFKELRAVLAEYRAGTFIF